MPAVGPRTPAGPPPGAPHRSAAGTSRRRRRSTGGASPSSWTPTSRRSCIQNPPPWHHYHSKLCHRWAAIRVRREGAPRFSGVLSGPVLGPVPGPAADAAGPLASGVWQGMCAKMTRHRAASGLSGVDIGEPDPCRGGGSPAPAGRGGGDPTQRLRKCEQLRMATDYDAPRKTEEDLNEDSIEELKSRRTDKPSAVVDEDETDLGRRLRTPGRGSVRRGAASPGAARPGRRIHLCLVLPGPPPLADRPRKRRPEVLQGLRRLAPQRRLASGTGRRRAHRGGGWRPASTACGRMGR